MMLNKFHFKRCCYALVMLLYPISTMSYNNNNAYKLVSYYFDTILPSAYIQRLYYHRADDVKNFCSYFLPFVFFVDFNILIVFKTCSSYVF